MFTIGNIHALAGDGGCCESSCKALYADICACFSSLLLTISSYIFLVVHYSRNVAENVIDPCQRPQTRLNALRHRAIFFFSENKQRV
jgi:hypothetical protein